MEQVYGSVKLCAYAIKMSILMIITWLSEIARTEKNVCFPYQILFHMSAKNTKHTGTCYLLDYLRMITSVYPLLVGLVKEMPSMIGFKRSLEKQAFHVMIMDQDYMTFATPSVSMP